MTEDIESLYNSPYMQELIGAIKTVSDQVTSGTVVVSTSSLALASGATELAGAVSGNGLMSEMLEAMDDIAVSSGSINKIIKAIAEASDGQATDVN